jgi:hypothetical protein
MAPVRLAPLTSVAALVAACTGEGARDHRGVGEDDAVCGDGVVTGAEVCDDGRNDPLDGGCMPGCRVVDDSDALFARDLIRIDIDLPADAWEALRHERKTRHSAFGTPDCRTRPIDNPYGWYPATVTIDGQRHEQVGVRKKGHIGSQSTRKPSLKLKLDEVIEGQHHLGLRRFALNNSKSDRSYARTCLTYRVFAAAGVPAPRCTYASVTLRGAPLGVFVAIEEVGKPFLARRLADPEGNLYEGTASDFRSEFIGGFEQETNERSDPSRDDLRAVAAVIEGARDDELVAALEPLIDLDAFYRFWALESLVWHRDGYSGNANNFFVYADPARGGRMWFLPWGPDSTFQRDTRPSVPDSVLAFGSLATRLYALPEGRDRYHLELAALLDGVWRPDELVGEIERVTALLEPELPAVDAAEIGPAADLLAEVIAERRAAIDAALAAGPPAWTDGMRGLPCRTPVGPIEGRFSTRWDTLTQNIFEAGSGELGLSLRGEPVVVQQVGARAGPTTAGPGRLQMTANLAGNRRLSITASFPDERWFDPFMVVGSHELVAPPLGMAMTELDLSTSPATVVARYEIGEGTWTFDAVEASPGAPLTGRFSATLYLVP